MKRDFLWFLLCGLWAIMLGLWLFMFSAVSAHRVHAQTSGSASVTLTLATSVIPGNLYINGTQALAVPACSKAAKCNANLMLCNRASTAYGGVIQGGCIAINGTGHTMLNVSVEDFNTPAGATTPVGTNFPIGIIDSSGLPAGETNTVP